MPNDATASCSEPAAASIKTGGGTAGRASAVEKWKWSEVDRSGGSSQGLRAGSGIYIRGAVKFKPESIFLELPLHRRIKVM